MVFLQKKAFIFIRFLHYLTITLIILLSCFYFCLKFRLILMPFQIIRAKFIQQMDNFNQALSDQLPQFLCKSVRRKAKLSVCDFNFKQNIKSNALSNRKKSLSHHIFVNPHPQPQPTLHSIIQHQQQIKKDERMYKNPSAGDRLLLQQFYKEAEQVNFLSPLRYRSEHKLPTLNKCNVELNIDENEQEKFIRVKKQATKIRLGKMHGNYRQISQKNEVVRVKQEINTEGKQEKQLTSLQSSPAKVVDDPLKQRCYFIRNLMLNASTLIQSQNKQRASLNLLVNKLKQNQRRVVRLNPGSQQKKQEQLMSPAQLRTNKMHYQELAKNTIKQQIMKRFTKKILKINAQSDIGSRKKEQNFVSGWNNAIEEHDEF